MGESNKCVDCGFELDYSDEDIPQCFRCDSQEWRRMCDKLTDRDTQIIEHNVHLTAERDKYRDAYNDLIFAVSHKYEGETRHQTALKYIQQAEESSGEACANPDNGADFARQVKAELEGE